MKTRRAEYVPIQVHALRTTGANAVDLFVQYEAGSEPRLYCRAGNRPNEAQFTELANAGIENLYVRSGDFSVFSSALLESIDEVVQNPLIHSADKFAALQLAVAVTVEQTLRLLDCTKFRQLAGRVADKLVDLFGQQDPLPRELFRLARHDSAAFTHVTNVASYSIILAREIGISDVDDLRKIAVGALLHDVGKRFIPPAILNKVDRVTPEEREAIEAHPTRGYAELCSSNELDFGQLMMVYQHHERVDGTGYPVRVAQPEIHAWARLLSVVNAFDALTARRPNRHPASPDSVLAYQRQHAGTRFDGDFVECWISAMTKA
ncbi:MAG: HD domain-containing phosphohydrolase [Pirellulales bacterium]